MIQETSLLRDAAATAIPAGDAAVLPAGTSVTVIQTLGSHVTVRTDRGLFRLDRVAADAVAGLRLETDAGAAPADGDFSEERVWETLKTCFDPEIPVNIVDLGLIYDLAVEPTPAGGHRVQVKMTLTAPGCGMGPVIAEDARSKLARLPMVEAAEVHVVWEPQWTPHMISSAGRKVLGME